MLEKPAQTAGRLARQVQIDMTRKKSNLEILVMAPFKQIFQNKRRLWGLVGFGLMAAAVFLAFHSPRAHLDSSREISAVGPNPTPGADSDPDSRPEQSVPPGPAESLAAGSSPPGLETAGSGPLDPPVPDRPPGALDAMPGAGDSPPEAHFVTTPSEYDQHASVLVSLIQAVRASGPEASRHVPGLLASSDPMDQVSGLVLMAGLGMQNAPHDWAAYSPAVVLASVDLCGALFDAASAQALLAEWTKSMGGPRPAGETAHRLLLAAQLPYGGGSAALDLMESVNDPQAIRAGLRIFAVDAELSPAVRTEALLRLRERMEFEAYREFVRACAERARQEGDAWAARADRLLDRLEGPPDVMSGPQRVDLAFIEKALAQSYPGGIEDLELYLRREAQAGRVKMDAEAKAFFLESLADLDEKTLPGSDVAALQRLRRLLDSGHFQP